MPPRPQPPRRGPLSGCLGVFLVLGGLFFGSLIVAAFLLNTTSSLPPTTTSSPGTSTPSPGAPGAQPPSDGTAPARPSGPAPAPELNPDPIPQPRTDAELFALLEENPLYAQSVSSQVDCGLTAESVVGMSPAEMEAYLTEATACLGWVWDDAVQGAGWQTHRPPVTVYSETGTSACGQLPAGNAVYCSADQELYVAADLPEYVPELDQPLGTDLVLAHEYGHFIQGRTGIIASGHMLQNYHGVDSVAGEDASRRAELQADCLAGIYLGRVAESQGTSADALAPTFAVFGDDAYGGTVGGHGSAEARTRWARAGIESVDIGVCNTWVADDDEVY